MSESTQTRAKPPTPNTSALRAYCRALRGTLPEPKLNAHRQAPATVMATTLDCGVRITAKWVWVTRAREPGRFEVVYYAYRPRGQYICHTMGANVFASKLSHHLRKLYAQGHLSVHSTPDPTPP